MELKACNTREATAIRQIEMFFSLTIVVTLGESVLLLRILLIISNNLMLITTRKVLRGKMILEKWNC